MTWPPGESEWDEILHRLPAESRASARAGVEAAVQAYLTGSGDTELSTEHAKQWRRVKKLAASKTLAAFCDSIRKLRLYQPLDPEAEWLLGLADQLEEVPNKAAARALVYRPRSKKARLYAALMRAWTNAGGNLGASEQGPLQSFLCRVVQKLGFRLSDRGAKDVIRREQGRREALTILNVVFAGKGGMTANA